MKFIRLRRKGQRCFLETARATYVHPARPGCRITLYGVAHIGEEAYYNRIQGDLTGQDVVLYEYVSENGRRPKPGRAPYHNIIAKFMGLSSQMESLQYHLPNFVHADISVEELKTRCGTSDLRQVVSSVFSVPIKLVVAASKLWALSPVRWMARGFVELACLATRLNPTLTNRIKSRLAATLSTEDPWALGLSESDPKHVILYERNKIVYEAAQRELTLGRKTISILYGAAHMPDLENRLLSEGWKLEDSQWLTVWRYQDRLRRKVRTNTSVYGNFAWPLPDSDGKLPTF